MPYKFITKKKQLILITIYVILILDINGVKKRWRSLRDKFIKMHKVQKLPSGSGGGKKSKWSYCSQMTFLIPYIEFRE